MSAARRGLAGSAAVMFSGTLVSRLLGLVRNILLVGAIGVTGAGNSFAVANKLPNVVYMLVAGGVLNAILVPQIVRAMKARDGGDEYVNRLLTIAGAALLALTAVLTAGATVLVTIYAAELDPAWFELAVAFALWCVPQLFFYGMYTLLGQVLNARGIFGPFMWAPAANNVIAIIGLVLYLVLFGGTATGAHEDPAAWTPLRTAVIAGTATLGVAVQALVLVVPLRRAGFRFRPRWGLRGSGLGRASRVASWAFASLLVAQLGFIAVSNLAAAAAGSGEGFVAGNAAWENANFLYLLPQSLITVSLVTALFTRVSGYAASGDAAAVRDDLSLGLRTIAVFTVFAGGALAVVALPLIQAILPTTTFAEAQGIARIVVALLAGIAALGAFTMIQRVYYAFEDTRSLFRLQIPLTAIVIVGCLVSTLLPPAWWLVGAAVATTVSNVVGSVVAYLALRRKLPSLDGARVLRTHVRLVIAATPALLLGWLLLHLLGPAATADAVVLRMLQALGRIAAAGTVMAVVYVVLLRLLQVSELDVIARPALRAARRLAARVPGVGGRGGDGHGPAGAVSTMEADGTGGPGPGLHGSRSHRGSERLDEHEAGIAPAPAPGTKLSGRYLIDRELPPMLPGTARWRGQDQILEREVQALILPGTSGISLETIDAARRAALVDDPRLERILDVGVHEGDAFIVTDVAAGRSLGELATGGTLPPEQARAVVGEAAGALEAARRRGVHHLVLGPASVHVTGDGQVRVSGLGVAAAYLSADDDDPLAAAHTDTVGLVRLLYLALTGEWPAPAGGADSPHGPGPARSVAGVPVAPVSLRPDVPADLDALCIRTLEQGADGPRTPSELIRELAPWRDINVDALAGEQWTPHGAGAADVAGATAGDGAAAGTTTGGVTAGEAPKGGGAAAAGAAAAGATALGADQAAEAAGAWAAPEAGTTGAGRAQVGGAPTDAGTSTERTDGREGDSDTAEPSTPPLDTTRWQPRELPADHRPADFTSVVGVPAPDTPDPSTPPLDTSRWRPRELPADHRPADFTSVVDAPATNAPPTAARHPRGSVISASLGAAAGGIAATVATATRTGGSTVATATRRGSSAFATATRTGSSTVAERASATRERISAAAADRAARRAEREEREEALQREADVEAAADRAAQRAQREEQEQALQREADIAAAANRASAPPAADDPALPATDEDMQPDSRAVGATAIGATAAGAPAVGGGVDDAPGQPQEQAWEEEAVAPEPPGDGAPVPFRERMLDPTPIVLAVAALAVLIGAILAVRTVMAEPEPYTAPPPPAPTAPASPSPAQTSDPAPEETTATAAPEETTAPPPAPAIASLAPLDPEGDGAENPDITDQALDGDPSTFWRSRSYVDPSYGIKSGIGLHVALEEETVVEEVALDLMGEGGNVEIRATDASTPTEGEVLASGEMGPDTTFTFNEPVTTDELVLWFTELPVADSDGRNRLEIAELDLE